MEHSIKSIKLSSKSPYIFKRPLSQQVFSISLLESQPEDKQELQAKPWLIFIAF